MDCKKLTEMCLREKITREVIQEVLEENRRKVEEEKREWEKLFETKSQKETEFLDKLQSQYPLYTSQPASLYAEKFGSKKTHPFRKCTKFSKPIYEQFEGPFKPE